MRLYTHICKYNGKQFFSALAAARRLAERLAEKRAAIEAMPTSTIAEIEAKTAAWESFYAEAKTNRLAQAADLYTAAFIEEKKGTLVPMTANLRALLAGEAINASSSAMLDAASAACREANVLHWPLVFPSVFGKGGFDVFCRRRVSVAQERDPPARPPCPGRAGARPTTASATRPALVLVLDC